MTRFRPVPIAAVGLVLAALVPPCAAEIVDHRTPAGRAGADGLDRGLDARSRQRDALSRSLDRQQQRMDTTRQRRDLNDRLDNRPSNGRRTPIHRAD